MNINNFASNHKRICIHVFANHAIGCLLLGMTAFCASCTSEENYQGKLVLFNDLHDDTPLSPDTTFRCPTYTPLVNIIDSIILSYVTMIGHYSFDAYCLSAGQDVGHFLPRGHGHNEYISLSPIQQIYSEGGEYKTVLFAPNESKILIWNISKSLKNDSTIYDYVGNYSWKDKYSVSYSKQVMIDNESVLLYSPSIRTLPDEELTDPMYQIRTLRTNEPVKEIRIFAHAINNYKSKVLPECYLDASFSLKPDRKKFVEAMNWLPQINIVDISSGKVNGRRLKEVQDESVFSTDMKDAMFCYKHVVSDDNHIYALWAGSPRSELRPDIGYHTVHVFDWEGKLIKKYKLKEPINELTLDMQNGILYGWNTEKQILYRYNTMLSDV